MAKIKEDKSCPNTLSGKHFWVKHDHGPNGGYDYVICLFCPMVNDIAYKLKRDSIYDI